MSGSSVLTRIIPRLESFRFVLTLDIQRKTIILTQFVWKESKNKEIQSKRNVSFELVLEALAENKIVNIVDNPNRKYFEQKIYILELNAYPHFVPFRDLDDDTRELITIIPCRKLKRIMGGKNEKKRQTD